MNSNKNVLITTKFVKPWPLLQDYCSHLKHGKDNEAGEVCQKHWGMKTKINKIQHYDNGSKEPHAKDSPLKNKNEEKYIYVKLFFYLPSLKSTWLKSAPAKSNHCGSLRFSLLHLVMITCTSCPREASSIVLGAGGLLSSCESISIPKSLRYCV